MKVQLNGYKSDTELTKYLTDFYSRFDAHDFSNIHVETRNNLLSAPPVDLFFGVDDVVRGLKRCKPRKCHGPNQISAHMLRVCANQLVPIFNKIFHPSLYQHRVPSPWKQLVIVLLAKTKNPKLLNNFQPIALTSLVMKQFEKLMKAELLEKTERLLDPLQFAYRTKRRGCHYHLTQPPS